MDREFFDEQSEPHEPTLLMLILLLSPLFLAIIAATFATHNNLIVDELPFIGWF